jgi:hypothetical protein
VRAGKHLDILTAGQIKNPARVGAGAIQTDIAGDTGDRPQIEPFGMRQQPEDCQRIIHAGVAIEQ